MLRAQAVAHSGALAHLWDETALAWRDETDSQTGTRPDSKHMEIHGPNPGRNKLPGIAANVAMNLRPNLAEVWQIMADLGPSGRL